MRAALAALVMLLALPALSQESRPFNPIARPDASAPSAMPGTAPAPEALREMVMKTAQAVASAWNTPDLEKLLSPSFYDRQRLLDAIATQVPRDARLRIVGVQAMQVLGTSKRRARDGRGEETVTRVSVTLQTQIEFNDPVRGFQRLEGVNEAVFSFVGTF